MRTQRYTAAVLVIACLGLASTASAQERHRFWFEFDGGIASAHVAAGNFDDSRGWTGGGGLALGWTVNPRLLAGIDLRVEPLNIVGPIEGEVGMLSRGSTSRVLSISVTRLLRQGNDRRLISRSQLRGVGHHPDGRDRKRTGARLEARHRRSDDRRQLPLSREHAR